MKLNEIYSGAKAIALQMIVDAAPRDEEGFIISEDGITAWLKLNAQVGFRDDFLIDDKKRLILESSITFGKKALKRLEIRIANTNCGITLSSDVMDTLAGLPSKIDNMLQLELPSLKSFKGFPIECTTLHLHRFTTLEDYTDFPTAQYTYIEDYDLTDIRGLENIVKFSKSGYLAIPLENIKQGGLGLLNCPNLTKIMTIGARAIPAPFVIINKYLGRPDDIFECQAELVENGFEAFAEM